MATVVPPTRQQMIQWYATRVDDWAANAAALSLDPALVATLAGLINAAQDAQAGAIDARAASLAATVVFHNEADALKDFGAGLVKTIKAAVDTSGDENLYALALIPPPTPPAPLGPPETPTNLKGSINAEGQVELRWTASRVGGTSFRVERSLTQVGAAQGPWVLLSTVEERAFVDQAVPQGLASAHYRVKAQRAGGISVATEPVQVLFGTPAQGQQQGGLTLAA